MYAMIPSSCLDPARGTEARKGSGRCFLPLIVLLALLCLGISAICVYSGYPAVFHSIICIPVLLFSIYFSGRGLLYTSLLCLAYLLIVLFIPVHTETGAPSPVIPALVRIGLFELLAFMANRLSRRHAYTERLLDETRSRLDRQVRERTLHLQQEIEQRDRLQAAYREATEYHERIVAQMDLAMVVWNNDMYITNLNPAFEKLVGRPREDLVGRKLSTIPELEETVRNPGNGPQILNRPNRDNTVSKVLWSVSPIYLPEQSNPAMTVAAGIRVPE